MFSLARLIVDVAFKIPEWLEPFIAEFNRPMHYDKHLVKFTRYTRRKRNVWQDEEHSSRALIVNRLGKKTDEMLQQENTYHKLLELDHYLFTMLRQRLINNRIYNQTFSLAVLMPYIVDELKTNKGIKIPDFNTSNKFLKYASGTDAHTTPDYLIYLAVILMAESEQMFIKGMRSLKDKDKAKREILGLDEMFHIAHRILLPTASASEQIAQEDKLPKDIVVEPHDVFTSKGKVYSIRFKHQDGNVKTFLLIADGGTGKTCATLRMIWSALNQKYSVVILTLDTAGQFRYISHHQDQRASHQLYNQIKNKQKEKPQGLPVTVFTRDTFLPCDQNIKKFTGSIEQWESLTKTPSVLVFTANHVRVLKSLYRWRRRNPSKKVLLVLDEAHELIGMMKRGKDWGKSAKINELLVNARAQWLPMILNTRHTRMLTGMALSSIDETYISYFSQEKDRNKIEKNFREHESILKRYIHRAEMKKKKEFIRIAADKSQLVKFLVPPCLLKNDKCGVLKRKIVFTR